MFPSSLPPFQPEVVLAALRQTLQDHELRMPPASYSDELPLPLHFAITHIGEALAILSGKVDWEGEREASEQHILDCATHELRQAVALLQNFRR